MAEHITIGDTAPRIQYLASGTDTGFTYPFPVFRAGDIAVHLGTDEVTDGFAVLGAGRSEGGTVLFDQPPAAGTVVTLRRRMPLGRVTDFQENGELRASVLNDELDAQAAAIQQVADDAFRALRFAPTDTAPTPILPPREARANRVLGFDAAGALTLHPALGGEMSGSMQQQGAGAVIRSVSEKLAEALTVSDFGAAGDGTTDDRAAIQAAFTAAGQAGRLVVIGEGDHAVSGPVSLPAGAAGLVMRGRIVYAGSAAATVLTLGSGTSGPVQGKLWRGIRVIRANQSAWSSEGDVGVLVRTPSDCSIEILEAAGFTIGVRVLAEGGTASGSHLSLGRIANARIGLDLRSGNATGVLAGLRIEGGRFTVGASVNPAADRFGARISASSGANRTSGGFVFAGPFFSLGGGAAAAIPFLVETDGRGLAAHDIRLEGSGATVARHTGAAEDHVYEVSAATEPGPLTVEYTATATRAGGTVATRHAAAPALAQTRLVAAVPNLRAAAFRWAAGLTGFDQLACLETSGAAPATLRDAARPGLDGFTLGARGVTLGLGRGLGFAVDTRTCRSFSLAYDGDPARLVVFCFDAAGALLTDAAGVLVRASTDAMQYEPARGIWSAGTEMAEANRTALPALTFSPLVAFAIIGLARGGADAELRAIRLYADARRSPALLAGLADLPHGRRELAAEASWDPPSLAANASVVQTVAVPGAAVGDAVTVGFTVPSANVLMLGTVTAPDTVSVIAWNRAAVATDLTAGTLRLRVIKT
ncbi:MAG: phage tail fiber protein [Acetobacteraceae bacterium]|jgi:hypothetical protein|nr:phage tail fiber protein [Acetobacteraceae bacterium]